MNQENESTDGLHEVDMSRLQTLVNKRVRKHKEERLTHDQIAKRVWDGPQKKPTPWYLRALPAWVEVAAWSVVALLMFFVILLSSLSVWSS